MIATIVSPTGEDQGWSLNEVAPPDRVKPSNEPVRKYVVQRTDGKPVDPNARYLVLRLDTDPFARKAAEVYAESVGKHHPALAASILKACAATMKPGWSLPTAPRCECQSTCRPMAFERSGRWSLEWECIECCEPVAAAPIAWPFAEGFAKGSDFERIGFAWDCD